MVPPMSVIHSLPATCCSMASLTMSIPMGGGYIKPLAPWCKTHVSELTFSGHTSLARGKFQKKKLTAPHPCYLLDTMPWWMHTNSYSFASGCGSQSSWLSRKCFSMYTLRSQPFSPHVSPSLHWSAVCSSVRVSRFSISAFRSSNDIVDCCLVGS